MSALENGITEYDECPFCKGMGHTHCKECKHEVICQHCNGMGKREVYTGACYKIHWTFS